MKFIKIFLETVPSCHSSFRYALCISWLLVHNLRTIMERRGRNTFLEKKIHINYLLKSSILERTGGEHLLHEQKPWIPWTLPAFKKMFPSSTYTRLSLTYHILFTGWKAPKATWPIIFLGSWLTICSMNKTPQHLVNIVWGYIYLVPTEC